MPKHHILDTSLSSLVFKSLFDLYSESEFQRECCSISDLAFAQLGVLRCFSSEKTGQGFLQLHADEGVADIDPGHFFRVNLRNHHMSTLAISDPKDGKKKEHDMAVIKRCLREELRYEATKGEITMLVWDKACIDYMHLYKLRWDIEKIFYQFKSKMEERKSWGSPLETKKAHAMFECIAHNLALPLEDDIKKTEGMYDELEEVKSKGRLKSRELEEKKKKPSYINTIVLRCTHRTMRFIRWLRNKIYSEAPLSQSLARLRQLWSPNNR